MHVWRKSCCSPRALTRGLGTHPLLGACLFVAGEAAGASPATAPGVHRQQRDTVPCDETVLPAGGDAEPGRVLLDFAGLSFVLPDGMRRANPAEMRRLGAASGSVFFNDELSAVIITSLVAPRTRIDSPEDMARDLAEAGVRVDAMRVMDHGGTQWWVFESNHRPGASNQRAWSYVTRYGGGC